MLEILKPGLLATVQDLGRPGLGRFGVSPAGAMDPLALRVANRLVGNDDGAAALELTGPGAELRFAEAATFALGGGDLGAELEGQPVALWRAHRAAAGATLRLPRRVRGARAVLAVAGGVQGQPVLGSASTDLDAGLGGGRLARGQRLATGPARAPRPAPLVDFAYQDPFQLRYLPAEDPAIASDSAALFGQAAFKVSDRSNRTGYRLTGPSLPVMAAADRLSAPIAPGTIQLPPGGQPILLMADRQTIGGYPVLGHLIAADRPKAAQLWPGDEIHFRPVPLEEAHRAAARLADALRAST
jgi:antagonist of KipI